jgi:hypothetical protein
VSIPCPSCGCATPEGTLCVEDSAALSAMLAAVPQLLEQLEVAISKQAKTAGGGKAGKGTAHLKSPVNWGVAAVRDALLVELALWGTDVLAIRKRPDAGRAVSGIGRAIKDAYRAIDRMQDRQYLGRCDVRPRTGHLCHAEIWAKPGAHQVTCSQCEHTHEVGERRAWLLQRAEDMLFTVKEASRYVGRDRAHPGHRGQHPRLPAPWTARLPGGHDDPAGRPAGRGVDESRGRVRRVLSMPPPGVDITEKWRTEQLRLHRMRVRRAVTLS